jgi:cell wall-associated NlpC family hydrolase
MRSCLLVVLAALLFSCQNDVSISSNLVECPAGIAERALFYAYNYSKADTEYELGGQDMLRAIRVDCSGLVVNCYKYATINTSYYLPFNDAAVINFYQEWTIETRTPKPGDLIFMGNDKNEPSHMAIFVENKGGNIYFIDSTRRPENGIAGVTKRYYAETDNRFLSFGILLLGTR